MIFDPWGIENLELLGKKYQDLNAFYKTSDERNIYAKILKNSEIYGNQFKFYVFNGNSLEISFPSN